MLLAGEVCMSQGPLWIRLDCAASRLWRCIGVMPLPAAGIGPFHWTRAALHWKGLHPSSWFEYLWGFARLLQRTRRHLDSQLPVRMRNLQVCGKANCLDFRQEESAHEATIRTKYSAASSRVDVPGHFTRKLTPMPLGSPAAAQAKKAARTRRGRLRTVLGILQVADRRNVMQARVSWATRSDQV